MNETVSQILPHLKEALFILDYCLGFVAGVLCYLAFSQR